MKEDPPQINPPLGIMPQWRWREIRSNELSKSIALTTLWLERVEISHKQRTSVHAKVEGWASELAEHHAWLAKRTDKSETYTL